MKPKQVVIICALKLQLEQLLREIDPKEFWFDKMSPTMEAAVDQARQLLKKLDGVELEEDPKPSDCNLSDLVVRLEKSARVIEQNAITSSAVAGYASRHLKDQEIIAELQQRLHTVPADARVSLNLLDAAHEVVAFAKHNTWPEAGSVTFADFMQKLDHLETILRRLNPNAAQA